MQCEFMSSNVRVVFTLVTSDFWNKRCSDVSNTLKKLYLTGMSESAEREMFKTRAKNEGECARGKQVPCTLPSHLPD